MLSLSDVESGLELGKESVDEGSRAVDRCWGTGGCARERALEPAGI